MGRKCLGEVSCLREEIITNQTLALLLFWFHCIFDICEFKNPDNCPGLARHVRSRAGVRPSVLQPDHSPAAGFVELRRRFGLVSAEIYLGESAGWKKHYSYFLSS